MAYTPNSTIHGLNGLEWNSDFTASRDDKGKWTGSESFTCKLTEATTLIPSNGTQCQLPGWSFMLVSSVKVSNIEGDLAQVTCEYGGFQDGDGDDESEPDYTYELGITTSEQPIETNHYFHEVSQEELQIIQNVKSGQLRQVKDTPYTYQNSSDHEYAVKFEVTSEIGRELVDYVLKGVESFLQPGQIWRVSFTSKHLPSASILNGVGKITSAINAPSVGAGRNWLFIGCNVTETAKVYSISYEWMLSGEGGFDENLYS